MIHILQNVTKAFTRSYSDRYSLSNWTDTIFFCEQYFIEDKMYSLLFIYKIQSAPHKKHYSNSVK